MISASVLKLAGSNVVRPLAPRGHVAFPSDALFVAFIIELVMPFKGTGGRVAARLLVLGDCVDGAGLVPRWCPQPTRSDPEQGAWSKPRTLPGVAHSPQINTTKVEANLPLTGEERTD